MGDPNSRGWVMILSAVFCLALSLWVFRPGGSFVSASSEAVPVEVTGRVVYPDGSTVPAPGLVVTVCDQTAEFDDQGRFLVTIDPGGPCDAMASDPRHTGQLRSVVPGRFDDPLLIPMKPLD